MRFAQGVNYESTSKENILRKTGTPAAVQRYTAQLYPEYCDYDARAEVMEFYELFYGCTLTEAQFHDLTKDAVLN